MAHYINLKHRIYDTFARRASGLKAAMEHKQTQIITIDNKKWIIPYDPEFKFYEAMLECVEVARTVEGAQTILFKGQQAQVFTKINESYTDALDYRLPFERVLIQFDEPVSIPYTKTNYRDYDRSRLIAAAAWQRESTREEFESSVNTSKKRRIAYGQNPDELLMNIDFGDSDRVLINQICFLYEDWGTEFIGWASGRDQEFLASTGESRKSAMLQWKNVIIACIGYINCENIYLHREGMVPEAVNAKRERKGKSRLEPYYICRIRGVNYDNPVATGQGVAHSIRYDVRGHFRRLATGKTIWVRPHQRGLANELYVPKTYLVDKRVQP